jgi:2,4-dichlorophenol 6-monooxygenase
MAKTVETDVLVVGAGPAGAISALLLSTYGIRTIMINKYGSTSPGPRAHITNQRAMEILRDLDLEEPAKTLAVPQEKMGHLFARSLVDEEFGRIYSWSTHPEAKARHDLASPCAICDLPQYYFEPLVTAQCALRGSDVRLRTEYVSHVQDADGVTATLRDLLTDTDYQVRAKYLIGADGARSKVAQDIGLPFEGRMATGDSGSLNIEFTADLSALVQHRPSDMFWLLQTGSGLNGTGVGVLRMVRPWHKWVCVWGYELANGAPQLSTEQARAVVQKLIGTDDIPVTIDGMSTWTINQQYAGRNSAGRVFCMGDAVHRHSPMGGLGLNTSVQDAYNLAWKLAAVIKGQAGAELLASFDAERSPIAKQIGVHLRDASADVRGAGHPARSDRAGHGPGDRAPQGTHRGRRRAPHGAAQGDRRDDRDLRRRPWRRDEPALPVRRDRFRRQRGPRLRARRAAVPPAEHAAGRAPAPRLADIRPSPCLDPRPVRQGPFHLADRSRRQRLGEGCRRGSA